MIPQVPIKIHKSKWLIVPFVAGIIVIMLVVQGLIYVSSANNSKKDILGAATAAYTDLSSASASLSGQNFTDAQLKFTQALANLNSAQSKLDKFKSLQLVATQAKSADQILSGATHLATAGQKLTSAIEVFGDLKITSGGVETTNLADKLRANKGTLDEALVELTQAKSEFDSVGNIPPDYAESLQKARDQVSALIGMLTNLTNLEDIYLGFFGTGPRVYLLVFENYDEVRATGGFIGTYGVIKINDGKIADLKIDSIYDLDGHIYDNIAAPGPFQPYIKKWGIRDANWFADFPTSARKLLQFFESGSQTADGVLAFTPAMFEDLLTLTGPIHMDKYNVTLDAQNFQEIVQYKTSVDYDKKSNNPKQMLADFAPLLLDKLSTLNQEGWLRLLEIMQSNLLQKQVLLYSKDANLEKNIEQLKVAGNILPQDQDYLNIVNTNLGGTKTDLKVTQSAELHSKILSDGSIIDTLKVTRTNHAVDRNVNFMRVLVPIGSTLVSSSGADSHEFNKSAAEGFRTDPDLAAWDNGEILGHTFITTESGKTEFASWLTLEPGESKTVTQVYMIPYKAKTNVVSGETVYSLLFQKQNGVPDYYLSASLDPGPLKPYWHSSDVGLDSQLVKFDYTTKSDQYWAVLLTK
jgi:hypothetical protein